MARVPKAFKDMNTDHLVCRIQHKWDIQIVTVERWKGREVYDTYWECERCLTSKHTITYKDGTRGNDQARKYPANYLVTKLNSEWGGRREFNRNARAELYGRLSPDGGGKRRKKGR